MCAHELIDQMRSICLFIQKCQLLCQKVMICYVKSFPFFVIVYRKVLQIRQALGYIAKSVHRV